MLEFWHTAFPVVFGLLGFAVYVVGAFLSAWSDT